ncbi:MAG: hypothetical protein J5654_12510 [Victivallales bacterium]|nr:hypothetical protein [Victivallales bacterium]
MTPDFLPFESGPWRGICHRDFAVPDGNLDDWLARLAKTSNRHYASRWIAAPNIECPWFVKVLTAASEHDNLWNRLKWRLRTSRSLHVWRISQELQANGFGCPVIQLAARKRAWQPLGWPTDVLVMSPVEGQMVQTLLKNESAQDILNIVAQELARFHAAGFVHGDCLPGNLFLESSGRLNFIDNDRTIRVHAWNRLPSIRRNLVQFAFHLLRRNLVTRDQAQNFLLNYVQSAQWSKSMADRELARVWRWTDRRLSAESR